MIKKNIQILKIILLIIPFSFFGQNIIIKTTSGGYLVEDDIESIYGLTVSKNKTYPAYLFAVKSGFATQVFSIDSILNLNKPEYFINLSSIIPVDKKIVSKKIIFNGFSDNEKKIRIMESINRYNYITNVTTEITSEINENIVREKLFENNFNIKLDIDLFKQKKIDADYSLSGDILYYKSSSKGTPGFITQLIIKWTLYDVEKEKPVLKIITGGYSNNRKITSESEILKSTIEDAIGGLIVNKELSKILSSKSKILGQRTNSIIEINQVSENSKKINFTEKATETAITIKTKSTFGPAFIISSDGYIITNYHTIEDSSEIEAYFKNGLILPLKIICYDKNNDIALCKIPGIGYKSLQFDTANIQTKIGTEISLLNTSENIKDSKPFIFGRISSLKEINNDIYYKTDLDLKDKNYGNVVFNTAGEILGIISSYLKLENNENVIIPTYLILKTLKMKIVTNN